MAVGNLTSYLQDAALKDLLGQATYTAPINFYVALYTIAPSKTTPGTEVTGASYPATRPAITFNTVANGMTTNSNTITFGPAGAGGWGSVVAIAILDTNVVGNSTHQLWFGTLSTARTVNQGDSLVFDPNAITITLG